MTPLLIESRRPLSFGSGRSSLHPAITHAVLVAVTMCLSVAGFADEPSGGPRDFQPGVAIDWGATEVHVDTHVVLREGPLEFFACFAGKEHESILRFDATATHIYMAMGLVGLNPGRPPVFDPEKNAYRRPEGALIDIAVRWTVQGKTHETDAYTWMREVEYARCPLSRPWIFAGSIRRGDTLQADKTGVGVALVDFPDSLIAYSRRFPSRYGALWCEANTDAIPEIGTDVKLILRAARWIERDIRVDARSAVYVDGRFTTEEDLADVLRLQHTQKPQYRQRILLCDALRTDAAWLRRRLLAAGVEKGAFRLERPSRRAATRVFGGADRPGRDVCAPVVREGDSVRDRATRSCSQAW